MLENQTRILAQVPSMLTTERRLEFARLPGGWSAVAVVAIAILLGYAVLTLYRRESRAGGSARGRTWLGALRCVVLAVLLVVWMEPVLARYLHRRVDAYTLVLADTSASMSLVDSYPVPRERERVETVLGRSVQDGGIKRQDLLTHLLAPEHGNLLQRLRSRNGVKLFGVDQTARLLVTWPSAAGERIAARTADHNSPQGQTSRGAEPTLPALEAHGPTTDLGTSITQAVESVGASPIASIVLLSDGGLNRGRSAERIGALAAARDIPIYAVGIGDPSPPINVRVAGVDAPPAVFAGDPFTITAHLQAEGLKGHRIRVALFAQHTNGGAPEVLLERRTLNIASDPFSETVDFEHTVERAGRTVFRIVAESSKPETIVEDNVRRATVRIQDKQLRVLVVSGSPSWEYRALSRLLQRDESVDLSCWLQSASRDAVRDGNTVIDHLPNTTEEIVPYDAVILLDPQPARLDSEWPELAARWVSDAGGGLMYCAGRKFTSRFMHDEHMQDIIHLLPVVVDAESELVLSRIGHYQKTAWPIRIPERAWDHPALRLAEESSTNKAIWQRLGGVYWHYPVRHEKPVATVLMRHGNPQMRNSYGSHVLLASQLVGAGRTAFLAFDGTWRWRRYGEEYFNKFWIGTLRYIAEGRLTSGRERGTLRLERTTCHLGEAVRVTARLLDANFKPLTADRVLAEIDVDGQAAGDIELSPLPGRPGWYGATVIPRRTGMHRIRVLPPAVGTAAAVEVSETFLVTTPNLEMVNPRMNRRALKTIAEASGGAYFDLDEWARVEELLEDRHEELVIAARPTALWDRWYTLALLAGLLSLEWALRKRARLL